MNYTRKTGLLACYVMATLTLSACDGSQPFKDLQAYIESLKQPNTAAESGKDAVKQKDVPVSVKYEEIKRRSPFEVMEVAQTKGKDTSNPLQAYPLDVLRFVGTVTQNGDTIAFISAPDNKIYQIKAGDIIGDHDSEVIKIEPDRISLTEQYSENGNTAMKRVVTLQLKETSQ